MTHRSWDAPPGYVAVPTTDPLSPDKTNGAKTHADRAPPSPSRIHQEGLPRRFSAQPVFADGFASVAVSAITTSAQINGARECSEQLDGRTTPFEEAGAANLLFFDYGNFLHRHTLPFIILGSFMGLGCLVYPEFENWTLAECLFFSIEVVTAVGWGSVVPETNEGKLFTILYTVLATLVMASAISMIMDFIVESALDDLMDALESKALNSKDTDCPWANFRQRVLMVLFLLITGILFFWKVDGMTLVDASYFCIVSMTTIGFGDIIPQTGYGKIFCSLWIFVSVGCAASAISAYAKARAARHPELHFSKKMSSQDIRDMDDNKDGKVDRHEFAMHVLLDAKLISEDDIKIINETFDEFDIDGSGYLDQADLQSSTRISQTAARVITSKATSSMQAPQRSTALW